ncbi:transcription factor UNE10-like [Hibiscus syriacus]|uniref:Transcription factor UNE10-like n=1 Tax=Hibiscus syriacus TaxID=106335 RepID=A0A6A2X9T4_HIBSY|nr:transcription factor UNE10-like [Hibiscus syriacus]
MALMSSSPPPPPLYGVIGGLIPAGEINGSERSHSSPSSIETTITTVSVRSNRRRICCLILSSFTFSSITRRSNNDSNTGDCAVCLSKFEPDDQLRAALFVATRSTLIALIRGLAQTRLVLYAARLVCFRVGPHQVLLQSSNEAEPIGSGRRDSFQIEIGSVSLRRQPGSESGEQRRSYSIGSFDYIIEEEIEVTRNQTHQRNVSDKEEVAGAEAASEASLAAEVATRRNWLKEYLDRLSSSLSSRALSFRSSGRFFTGSSRRSDFAGSVGDYDVEANRSGEEISEMFRWLFSGV